MKIAVVTDSTAYLTKEEQEKYNIHVVPIPLTIDGQSYQEGVDISNAEFYDKLAHSSTFPSTSQPPVGEMIELYQQLAAEGYEAAISIFLTSAISGFVNTVTQVAEQLKDQIKIIPFDSHITVKLMGYLTIEAAKEVAAGKDLDTILANLDQLRQTFHSVFVVDDLQNLVRGGRLSNASAIVGSILKIKPLLTMDTPSYSIEAFEKVRSMKRAKLRCEQIFEEKIAQADYPIHAIVIHANAPEAGQKWLNKLSADHPEVTFELGYFGPVIGTHLGQGALAIGWMRDTDRCPL